VKRVCVKVKPLIRLPNKARSQSLGGRRMRTEEEERENVAVCDENGPQRRRRCRSGPGVVGGWGSSEVREGGGGEGSCDCQCAEINGCAAKRTIPYWDSLRHANMTLIFENRYM
jgi:hypothetical protein